MKIFAATACAFTLFALPTFAGDKAKDDCHHSAAPPQSAAKKTEAKADWVLVRGEKLSGKKAVALPELLKTAEGLDGKAISVEGKVRKACEKKGCWMELATDEKSPGVRVTFKDYAFFVPLDSAGSAAKVEGTVKVAELSEERAKHYESEGAIVPRGKDGKPREVQLIATGVELRR